MTKPESPDVVPVPSSVPPRSRRALRIALIAVVIVAVLAALGFGAYGLARADQARVAIRDIFIILLSLVTVIIGLLLAILVFQLQSLIALLRNEIKPILESAGQTVSTVRGTTTFVSDAVVSPVIAVAGYLSATRQALRVLVRREGSARRAHDRQPTPPAEPIG